MGEDDWDLDADQWLMMARCNSAARLIFPYGRSDQDAWALMAYRKWLQDGVPPEVLRDKRCPNIKEIHANRSPDLSKHHKWQTLSL